MKQRGTKKEDYRKFSFVAIFTQAVNYAPSYDSLFPVRTDFYSLHGLGPPRIKIVQYQFSPHSFRNVVGDFETVSTREPTHEPVPGIDFRPGHGHVKIEENPFSFRNDLRAGGHRRHRFGNGQWQSSTWRGRGSR